jgi:hypothetical protein
MLDLSWNEIKVEGAEDLSVALKSNKVKTTLFF